MSISIIVAMSKNGVIGNCNKIPWDIPEDLNYFHRKIKNKTIIMGRQTYISIGSCIPNTNSIVLSNSLPKIQKSKCTITNEFNKILLEYNKSKEELMVIGGGIIYKQFLPYTKKMYLTIIDKYIEGDTYFPLFKFNNWFLINNRLSKFRSYTYRFIDLKKK